MQLDSLDGAYAAFPPDAQVLLLRTKAQVGDEGTWRDNPFEGNPILHKTHVKPEDPELEAQAPAKGCLSDYSISQTSLEEAAGWTSELRSQQGRFTGLSPKD